ILWRCTLCAKHRVLCGKNINEFAPINCNFSFYLPDNLRIIVAVPFYFFKLSTMKFAVRISPVIFLSIATTFAYAQQRDDPAPEFPDSTTTFSEVLETRDSILQAVNFEEPDVLKGSQIPV